LDLVQEKGYELDYNTAGLFKEFCCETYPPQSIIQEAIIRNISIVYGSDSHGLGDVGRGYDQVRELLSNSHDKR
jgi:histidinol-phosphatase (PHP family)